MRAKVLSATVAAFGIAAIATPALADFWIVREGPTGKCMVVDRKPTDSKDHHRWRQWQGLHHTRRRRERVDGCL